MCGFFLGHFQKFLVITTRHRSYILFTIWVWKILFTIWVWKVLGLDIIDDGQTQYQPMFLHHGGSVIKEVVSFHVLKAYFDDDGNCFFNSFELLIILSYVMAYGLDVNELIVLRTNLLKCKEIILIL